LLISTVAIEISVCYGGNDVIPILR